MPEGPAQRDVVELEKMLIVALGELTMESTLMLIHCQQGRHATGTYGRVHAGRSHCHQRAFTPLRGH